MFSVSASQRQYYLHSGSLLVIANSPDSPQASGHETFAAIDNTIVVYNRSKLVRTYTEHDAPIRGLVLVGKVLLSYDAENVIKVGPPLFVPIALTSVCRSSTRRSVKSSIHYDPFRLLLLHASFIQLRTSINFFSAMKTE